MLLINNKPIYDFIIIGAGVSGSMLAQDLTLQGAKVLVLEAGRAFSRTTYPRKEIDSNSKLYWGGGVEFNRSADLALLRPKVVGGGSIVNQALMDRFDHLAFDSWRAESGVDYFGVDQMTPWYQAAEENLAIEKIETKWRNGNAKIFADGFEKNGFKCEPLTRAQRNCKFEEGNDCIECLSGCRIDSKQSTPITTLRRALKSGCHLISEFEVQGLKTSNDIQVVSGMYQGCSQEFKTKKVILAAGAIGNSRLLLANGFQSKLPSLGKNFYTHPQFMTLAIYPDVVNAHKGPLQSYKSADPNFRKQGFKLENVFAPPVALSMLLPHVGKEHFEKMKKITHMACIEVAVRDTNPGTIKVSASGRAIIEKTLNQEDQKRKKAGLSAIEAIFRSTGAQEIIPGAMGIGLHLMGGCGIGVDGNSSVTTPDFHLHDHRHIYVADSSIFPNAPGINPSLTIMALSKMAAHKMQKEIQ